MNADVVVDDDRGTKFGRKRNVQAIWSLLVRVFMDWVIQALYKHRAARWQSSEEMRVKAVEIPRNLGGDARGSGRHLPGRSKTLFLFHFHHGETFADMEV